MNTNVTVKRQTAQAKSFRTDIVLSVTTGILMAEGGYDEVHGLMDFFFPGIMTIGSAAMQPVAKEAILKAHPELGKLPPLEDEKWKEWRDSVMKMLPRSIILYGPMDVPQDVIKKSFDDFLDKKDSTK